VRVPDDNRGYLLWGWVTRQILSAPMVIAGLIVFALGYRSISPAVISLRFDPWRPYLDLMRLVRNQGLKKTDRTGTGTWRCSGIRCASIGARLPLVTTKKLHMRSIIYELLWFLRGETNTKYLKDNGVSIWDEWADENGELGPVYGTSMAHLAGASTAVTSIKSAAAIDLIRRNPDSRASSSMPGTWASSSKWALTPCHALFQFWVGDGNCPCQLYQRSADTFLGVPFNIASYALLRHMFAQQCDLGVGDFNLDGRRLPFIFESSAASRSTACVSRALCRNSRSNAGPRLYSNIGSKILRSRVRPASAYQSDSGSVSVFFMVYFSGEYMALAKVRTARLSKAQRPFVPSRRRWSKCGARKSRQRRYALRSIKKGTRIIEYLGERCRMPKPIAATQKGRRRWPHFFVHRR